MLLPYGNVGGTERHVLLLSRGLQEAGVAVRIALPDGPARDAFRAAGLPILPLPAPSIWSMPAWVSAIRTDAAQGTELVHVHAAMELVWAAKLAAPAVPRVFTAHGYHVELDYMKAGLMLNATAEAVIAVSEPEQARLLRYGLNAAMTRIVPNGIDLESLDGPSVTLKQDLGIPAGSLLIGMVNRLDPFKGVDLMLKALPRLRERHPNVFLGIVGNGPERPRLERLTQELGMTHAVRWLGERADLGNVLRSYDLFVTPSRKEAFGMAALEAMACGLPVLATDLPALRGLVRPGREGDLVPLDAGPETWSDALDALLSDPDRMARYSAEARERAKGFSHRHMARETHDLYRTLANALTPSPTP